MLYVKPIIYGLYLRFTFAEKNILYKESTENLSQRLEQHNNGLVTFTSKFKPWTLVYHETFTTRAEAMARVKFFKSGNGRECLKNVIEKSS